MDMNGALPVKRWNIVACVNSGFLYLRQFPIITVWKRLQCCKVHFMTENNIIDIHSILLYLQICIHMQQIYIHIYIFCMSIHLSLPSLNRLSDISIPTQALLPWWKHVVSWRCHGDFLLEQFFSNHTLVFSWFIPFLSLNHSAFFLSLWLLVSPAEDPGWQLLWLCEGQLMSLDSLVTRMKVFSGWPWASVTSLAFSLLSWTQICTNESTPWAEMIS